MPNLKSLNLDNTKVTDEGVKSVSGMEDLTWLHLGKTAITDASVDPLLRLKNLRYLSVRQSKMTSDGYYELDDYFFPKGGEVVAP